jgi:hypothetical protein
MGSTGGHPYAGFAYRGSANPFLKQLKDNRRQRLAASTADRGIR